MSGWCESWRELEDTGSTIRHKNTVIPSSRELHSGDREVLEEGGTGRYPRKLPLKIWNYSE
jgi:hypothetical protein